MGNNLKLFCLLFWINRELILTGLRPSFYINKSTFQRGVCVKLTPYPGKEGESYPSKDMKERRLVLEKVMVAGYRKLLRQLASLPQSMNGSGPGPQRGLVGLESKAEMEHPLKEES